MLTAVEDTHTTVESLHVYVSSNQRPELVLGFPSKWFDERMAGFLTMTVNDSDDNFDSVVVDWGDDATETYFSTGQRFLPHIYDIPNDRQEDRFTISVVAVDREPVYSVSCSPR